MTTTPSIYAPPPSGRPPEQNLAPRDIETLAEELVAYHALFSPLFVREEQRRWALAYLQGQLLTLVTASRSSRWRWPWSVAMSRPCSSSSASGPGTMTPSSGSTSRWWLRHWAIGLSRLQKVRVTFRPPPPRWHPPR